MSFLFNDKFYFSLFLVFCIIFNHAFFGGQHGIVGIDTVFFSVITEQEQLWQL